MSSTVMEAAVGAQTPLPVQLEQMAEARPEAIAVADDTTALTYPDLVRRVNHLANRLVEAGVAPEDRVGITMRHHADLLLAVLAVLRAGAAYVPIDPDYPAARRDLLARDSGLRAVISDPDLEPSLADVPVLHVTAGVADECDRPCPGPDQLACVIYTSGSTGVPKGVMITQRGLSNLALAAAGQFELGPGDRYLMLASVSFSASLEELFPPLVRGAAAVFPPDRGALSAVPELLAELRDRRITVVELQTAQWHLLVRHLDESADALPPALRLIVMGGERALPDLVARWHRHGLPLVHVYGPTETTATATYFEVPAGVRPDGDVLPIGRPIPGTYAVVVDADMRRVPPGEAGELLLGGDSLARGYLGRPAATARAFVPDPFSGRPGALLYRTGDLVRELPDGNLQFLDRVDQQIKVRGYRIEPAEVEAALQQHPSVREAVVTAREDVPGDRRLVGYVTADDGAVTSADLRAWLADRLPAYMIPSALVRLDELPLTAHRKVDRAALPEPSHQREGGFVAPAGEIEQQLAEIWAELLRVDRVGATDDFLELGGDSLLAVRMLARLRGRFGVRLSPRQAFAKRTVQGLAALIENAGGQAVSEPAPSAPVPSGPDAAKPAAESQQGMWLLSRLLPDSPLNNTAWQCRLRGPLDTEALRAAVADVVDRHEVLRSAYAEVAGQLMQVPATHAPGWQETDLSGHPTADRDTRLAELTAELARQPFDVAAGPLMRPTLVRLADDDHLLVVSLHHLIFDLRSLEVLLQDLADCYRARTAGAPTPAPAPQFAAPTGPDQAEVRDRTLGYWTEQLARMQPLRLPTDGDRPAGGYTGETRHFWLPPEVARAAARHGRQTGTSTFMVLLTAYLAWLRRWTGSEQLAVVTPLAGRERPGTEDVVGLCTVNSVVQATVGHDASFGQLLAQVRDNALTAYAHQGLSVEQAAEQLPGARGRRNLFRVLFSLQRDASMGVSWPGLDVGPIDDLPTGTAKLDLSLVFHERRDGLLGRVEYRTPGLTAEQADAIAAEYTAVLAAALSRPDAPLSQLSTDYLGDSK
ncbi:hypothetical protein ACTI_45420 [Actinoplanes sp. OR16]|uniref:non-ribosomal peptide synthetase n=1 Tax=Actinoplanes sp. OR16 TaxID=946334 RepID=UPI000F6D5136|nr:non-ribosomal peptide synthetase [Actinoplanes sp. OR16]BBH67857.1 hypothetical protein ACTI_45420 [Actinoplanes sp. OR16]